MKHSFSRITTACLYAAGWHEGRIIRTDHWESLLRSAGNPVHPAVVIFLREFGGLKVTHPHMGDLAQMETLHLNPSVAAKHFPISEDGLYDYNDRTGKALCAVGTVTDNRMLLMMASDGTAYAAVDDLLYLAGNSGPSAVEALCAGIEWSEIP